MIPQDIIQRVTRAHDAAVKAVARWEAATPGTRTKQRLYSLYLKTEDRFDGAMVALIDAAKDRQS